MARPRFEVVDDPLALTASANRQAETDAPEPARTAGDRQATRKPARAPKRNRAKPSDRLPAGRGSGEADELSGRPPLADPPALDEPLTLVAARLPRSLDRALDEHTQQLRRSRDRASQKKLPKQEVLAIAVWALGDPDDDRTAARLEALYEEYRGRRLAAAAAVALESARSATAED